ncbi:hypothetical protein GCM10009429_11720 [Dyella marensis]
MPGFRTWFVRRQERGLDEISLHFKDSFLEGMIVVGWKKALILRPDAQAGRRREGRGRAFVVRRMGMARGCPNGSRIGGGRPRVFHAERAQDAPRFDDPWSCPLCRAPATQPAA